MPTLVQHDRGRDQLHLIFDQARIVARQEWLTDYATIDLAADNEPVGINIFQYYSNTRWPLTEVLVEQYGLAKHLEDLRLVWGSFFAPPDYQIAAVKYEGPDGEEVIVGVGPE